MSLSMNSPLVDFSCRKKLDFILNADTFATASPKHVCNKHICLRVECLVARTISPSECAFAILVSKDLIASAKKESKDSCISCFTVSSSTHTSRNISPHQAIFRYLDLVTHQQAILSNLHPWILL